MKSGEKRGHFETVHLGKDGREIDVSLVMSPLKDLQGSVVGASVIARNIMRRKEFREIQVIGADTYTIELMAADPIAQAICADLNLSEEGAKEALIIVSARHAL